jgi:succinate dehydrogenase / fumarate reductase, cytochrome b subunit
VSSSAEERLPHASARFFLRRLHSISGVLPIGMFVVLHLGTQSRALNSQAAFEEGVKSRAAMPYVLIFEIAFVLLPLLFHALYGVKLSIESKPSVGRYPAQRNWMHLAQRITGMLAFAFIIWHMSEYWLPRVRGQIDAAAFYPLLVKNLSATRFGLPLAALGYVFGIAACVFHLANGLWGFCLTWGLTVTARAQRIAATVFGVLGLLLFVVGANTAIYFATGSRVAILPGSP